MFIKKLNTTSDVAKIQESLDEILAVTDWADKNQIGLNYRPGAKDTWHDACGSLYDYDKQEFIDNEYAFNQWNKLPEYLSEQLTNLIRTEKFRVGRVRFMRLKPKTGLSVHRDREVRYHLVLQTNKHAYIAHEVKEDRPELSELATTGITYHIPCDGNWYQIDTREVHYVYNGGTEDRIHLVVCGDPR